jgi:hypothetical protein
MAAETVRARIGGASMPLRTTLMRLAATPSSTSSRSVTDDTATYRRCR